MIRRPKKAGNTVSKRPENRFQRYAKMSEAKFLKVLRGFADFETVPQIAARSKLSERTVRELVWKLRFKMFEAVVRDPRIFHGVGTYLFDGGAMRDRAWRIFRHTGNPMAQAAYGAHHGLRHHRLTLQHEAAIMVENTVRSYCRMAGSPGGLFEMNDELRGIYANIIKGAEALAVMNVPPEMRPDYDEFIAEAEDLLAQADAILEAEQAEAVSSAYRPHGDPAPTICNDLRKYLIKHPLQ